MIKKIFETLIYNSLTKRIADYYRNTLQIDFQKTYQLNNNEKYKTKKN